MIIKEKIKIKISKKNIDYFKNIGYDNINLKDIIIINSNELSKGSHKEIKVKCDICGKEKYLSFQKYNKNFKNGNFYACSSKCAQEKVKKTSLEKFGYEYYTKTKDYKKRVEKTSLENHGTKHHTQSNKVKEKIKKTNIKKYGTKNIFTSEVIKNKIKKTNLDKYGSENIFASEEIKNKIKKTNLKNIGVEYPTQSEKIKEKIIKSNLKKYGVRNISELEEIKEKVKQTNIKNFGFESIFQLPENIKKAKFSKQNNWLKNLKKKNPNIKITNINFQNKKLNIYCEKGHEYEIPFNIFYLRNRINTEICTICNKIGNQSGLESQLLNFIKDNYNGEIQINKRKLISPLELDIYLPDLKIAFEFNGLYWHNELNKPHNYHLEKTELCKSKGIQLTQIYEDLWIYKKDIVKSILLNKLGKTPNKIYARKTKIREIIDNKLVREFLENNHIQGFIGSKIKLGLFHEDELVSLMSFGKRRIAMGKKKTNEGEWELLRFCNKLNTNVIGGASKLFKHFIKNYNPKEIITYADRSYSQGKMYEKLGFKFVGKTQPNYYYIIDGIRHHRFNFRKDKLVKEGYNSNKTEHEIMLERDIYRIYDSGNLKYIFT